MPTKRKMVDSEFDRNQSRAILIRYLETTGNTQLKDEAEYTTYCMIVKIMIKSGFHLHFILTFLCLCDAKLLLL